MTRVVKVGARYQVVIPKAIRKEIALRAGDEMIMAVAGKEIVLRPKGKRYSEYLRGLGKEIWRGIDAKAYVRKERRAWGN